MHKGLASWTSGLCFTAILCHRLFKID